MATVPRFSGPTVDPTVVQGGEQRAYDFGQEAIARGAQDVARVLGAVAENERKKADEAQLMEFEGQLYGTENAIFNDGEKGAFSKRGKDAIGISQVAMPEWEKQTGALIDALPARLRMNAQRMRMERTRRNALQLQKHELDQSDAYHDEQATSTIKLAADEALLKRDDPQAVATAADRAMLAADRLARGMSDEGKSLARRQAASGVYRSVLTATAEADPSAAAERLAEYRQFLTGEDQVAVEKTLRPYMIEADTNARLDAWLAGSEADIGSFEFEGAAASSAEAESIARASVGRTVGLESGGQADAKNPLSSATGAAQFISSTWMDMIQRHRPDLAKGRTKSEVLALRNDPALSKAMAEEYAVENCRGLYESGLPVTPQTAYLSHHFGLDGARRLLRAPPNTPVASILPAKDVAANPYLRGKTVAELMANHAKRAGEGKAATVANGAPTVTTDGRPDWTALTERAMAMPNPLQREAMLRTIRQRQGLDEARRQQQDRDVMEGIYTKIETFDPSAGAPRFTAAETAFLQREGRMAGVESRIEQRIAGQVVQSEPMLVDQISREAVLNPTAFARRDIRSDSHRLGTGDLARLLEMQRDVKDPAKRADWSDEQQRLEEAFYGLGIAPSGDAKGKDSGKANEMRERHRGELRMAWNAAVAAYTQDNGKKPVGAAADTLLRSVQRNYALRMADQGQRAEAGKPLFYEDAARDRANFDPAERARVRDAYRAKYGQAPTETWLDNFMARAAMRTGAKQ
jgi:hypothetical protein